RPSLDWRTSLAADIVTVDIDDSRGFYRVEGIELADLEGRSIPAFELVHEEGRGSGRAGSGVDVGVGGVIGSGGGGNVGVGLSFPLATRPSRPTSARRTRARIRLDDADAYRRAPEEWRIRVFLTDSDGVQSVAVIPAPTG
ncbi:MAG: hypothetical protein ACE5Q3_20050, partial [Alphaproteobacteria bacterium]